ncbi:MAG: transposase [Planctomycetota bacterium]
MPRSARLAPGGVVFHVLNRAVARQVISCADGDYRAFERLLAELLAETTVRLFTYCLMPTHWHFVLQPTRDGELSAFMQRLTTTHVRRWRLFRENVGDGHLYQGTFKSFPIETDEHFLTVCRYVERNPARARLVERAEDWRWGGLWRRLRPNPMPQAPVLSVWPVDAPDNWVERVNRPETLAELDELRECLKRGRPYGSPAWQATTAEQLGLDSSFHPRGRPLGWRKAK